MNGWTIKLKCCADKLVLLCLAILVCTKIGITSGCAAWPVDECVGIRVVEGAFPDSLSLVVGEPPFEVDFKSNSIFIRSDNEPTGIELDWQDRGVIDLIFRNDSLSIFASQPGSSKITLSAIQPRSECGLPPSITSHITINSPNESH